MAPTAGVDCDAVLDALDLLLVPNTLRQFDITNFSPAVRTSDPKYNDFSLQQFYTQSSWHHGRGSLEYSDPFSFYDSTNVFTLVRNQVTLAPLQNLTTKAAAASIAGNPVFFRLLTSSANLYVGTGGASRDLFVWTNASSVWTAESAGLSADPTDLSDFQGNFYLAQGEANNIRVKSGGSWGAGGVPAVYLKAFGQAVLYRSDNINEIYYTVDGTNWTGPFYIGDTNTSIRALEIMDGKLMVGKDDGLYQLQDGRVSQVLDFSFARDSNNFKNMKVWAGNLYFPILDGLYRLIGNTYQAVGPDLGAAGHAEGASYGHSFNDPTYKGLTAGKQGRIVDLIPTDTLLFAAVDGGASGTSQILVFNNQGWNQVLEGAASTKRIRAIFYTGSLAASGHLLNPRLWYGYDTDAYNAILPFGTEDPYDYSLQTYCASGTLTEPWFDAGLANVFKEWQEVFLYSEGLSANQTVQIAYELDDLGTYQNLLDDSGSAYAFTFSPYQRIRLPKNTVAKKIRLRYTLATSSSASTPKIKTCLVGFSVRPDAYFAWQVTARTGRNMRNPYTQQRSVADPGELSQLLTKARQSRSRLLWDDGNGEPSSTNLVLNSVFRVDSNSDGLADNWNEVDNPTTTLDIAYKKFGLRSQKVVTDTGTLQGVQTDAITTVTGTKYTASIYLYLQAGDAVTLQFIRSDTSAVLASAVQTAATTDWVRLECTAAAATTTSRVRVVRTLASATQATTFNVSGVQLEATNAKRDLLYQYRATSFISGDEPNCRWTGRAYLSTATRDAGHQVYVTNVQKMEIKRPSWAERVRGIGVEQRITFTVAEIGQS